MKKNIISLLLAVTMVVSNTDVAFAAIQSLTSYDSNTEVLSNDKKYITSYDEEERNYDEAKFENAEDKVEVKEASIEQTEKDKEDRVGNSNVDGVIKSNSDLISFDFATGIDPTIIKQEYESVNDNHEGDALFSVQERKYISPEATRIVSRNQNPYGTCWAFATVAAAEMSALKNKIKMRNGLSCDESVDLSELHLAYFCGKRLEAYDPLGGLDGDYNGKSDSTAFLKGGLMEYAIEALACWSGLARESDYPYDNSSKEINSMPSCYINWSEAQNDEFHLRGYYANDPVNDIDGTKKLIKDYGAVTISYHDIKTNLTYNGKNFGVGDAYSSDNNCYYIPFYAKDDHGVVIVGWDDNFSRNKFNNKPEGDGAWLVRNSWREGNSVDNYGNIHGQQATYFSYFWLSYYDKTINNVCYALDIDSVNKYDHNYQYDGTYLSGSVSNKTSYANIYTTKSDEILKAIYFSTHSSNVDYTVDIYTCVSRGSL